MHPRPSNLGILVDTKTVACRPALTVKTQWGRGREKSQQKHTQNTTHWLGTHIMTPHLYWMLAFARHVHKHTLERTTVATATGRHIRWHPVAPIYTHTHRGEFKLILPPYPPPKTGTKCKKKKKLHPKPRSSIPYPCVFFLPRLLNQPSNARQRGETQWNGKKKIKE